MSESPESPEPVAPQKKRSTGKVVAIVAASALVIIGLFPISNLFLAPAHGTALTTAAATHPEFSEAAAILEQNCLDCHSAHAKLPFYASLPFARGLIERDMRRGTSYVDLAQDLIPEGKPVSEVGLAKIEYVLDQETMPPAQYALMHWDRTLSDREVRVLRQAIAAVRAEHYTVAGVAPEFATDALQPLPDSVQVDDRKVALGDAMYHDTRLSGDGTLSCASCHGLDTGGCDRAPVSTGIDGQRGPINAPTVFNAVFHLAQFWDGRAADLQEQAAGPVANPIEMGANWDDVIARLNEDAELVAQFEHVYAVGVTKETVTNAIAEFEKTLVTPDSRFDRYLKGDSAALDEQQLAGMHLFYDNACSNCHVGKAMGGQSYERMGRNADYFTGRGDVTDVDYGRFNVTKEERDKHCFKVPSLRNIAQTYPYFHDASAETLEEAVKTMARYNGYREFSEAEVQQVAAFLGALTGEYNGRSLQ